MLLVIALLSQRLGAVTKRPKYYLLFFVAIALIGGSVLTRLLTLGTPAETLDLSVGLLYTLPLAIALTVSVIVAGRYWGWLLGEKTPGSPPSKK